MRSAQSSRYGSPSSRDSREPNKSSRLSGIERAAAQPGGLDWPELRVGRQASLGTSVSRKGSTVTNDNWNLYLNELARKNRKYGEVLTLGAIACHYVSDKEIRGMILRQRPKLKEDLKGARNYYYDVRDSIGSFIKNMGVSFNQIDIDLNFGEAYDLKGRVNFNNPKTAYDLPYTKAVMKLRETGEAFTGYDGKKVGIDLSQNRGLYEERKEILGHLASGLKLNTSEVRQDWEPHAVIMLLKPHLTIDQISTISFPHSKDAPTPETILLDPPKVDFIR